MTNAQCFKMDVIPGPKFKGQLFKALYNGKSEDIETLMESQDGDISLQNVCFKCLCKETCDCFLFYKRKEESILTEIELDRYSVMIENEHCPCDINLAPVLIQFSPLHLIIHRNHPHLIPYLIQKGSDISATDWLNDTALELALQTPERLEAVLSLLQLDAHQKGPVKQPLLFLAFQNHNDEYIKPLVDKGCNINEVNSIGDSLLLMAVMQSSSQNFISKLIQLGADVNVTSYTAYKCMEKAIRWRDIEFLQLLMDSGCDVNAQPSSEHLTALQMTVCQGLTPMTSVLIAAGADVNNCVNDIPPPLSLAAGEGRMEEARMLISAGCDVNQTQDHQYSAMHFAAWEGHVDMVQLLLDCGAEYKNQTRDKNTPLALACHGNWPSVIAKLLVLDKNVNNADKDLDCPLHYTTFNSNFECSLWLIREGADPHAENALRVTPVWNATYVNNVELVALFIKANVDVNIPSVGIDQAANSDSPVHVYSVPRTPLQVAVMKNYVHVAQLLAIQLTLEDIVEQMNYLIANNDLLDEILNETNGIMFWYKQATSSPRSLLSTCHRFIRQLLGRHIFRHVQCLEIPLTLQHYLTLSNIKLKEPYSDDIFC